MVETWKNDGTLQLVMKKIKENFDLSDYLGGGGYARIYRVRNQTMNQTRILKIMDFYYILHILEKQEITSIKQEFERIAERFINEARIYGKISHPNIVEIYDTNFVFIEYENEKIKIPYMILEYIQGASLKEVLIKNTSWDLKKIFQLCENVLPALQAIHNEGIIHRDIKPSNILIREKTREAVIIDFGIARDIESQITKTREFMGTIAYASPEMLKDSKKISLETDIYSFGVVLYEMITGELPFTGNRADIFHGHLNVVKSIPEETFPRDPRCLDRINKIVKKAMAKEIENRYRNALEFLSDIKQLELELDDQKILHKRKIKKHEKPKKKLSQDFDSTALKDRELIGRYKVLDIIGPGGRGFVYKVYDRKDQDEKAVKVFPPKYNFQPGLLEQIKDEFEAAQKIPHTNLVSLYSLEKQDNLHFIVMEYIDGVNLEEKLKKIPDNRLEEKEALAIMKQVLSVMIQAHQNQVLHHTIKPENIMIKQDGNIKMINFPGKIQLNSTREEFNGMEPPADDLAYIPPEERPTQWKEKIMQADAWMFGVTLYRLLMGKLPPHTQIQNQLVSYPGISPETKRFLIKCTAENPTERYNTPDEIYNELYREEKQEQKETPRFLSFLKSLFGKGK